MRSEGARETTGEGWLARMGGGGELKEEPFSYKTLLLKRCCKPPSMCWGWLMSATAWAGLRGSLLFPFFLYHVPFRRHVRILQAAAVSTVGENLFFPILNQCASLTKINTHTNTTVNRGTEHLKSKQITPNPTEFSLIRQSKISSPPPPPLSPHTLLYPEQMTTFHPQTFL